MLSIFTSVTAFTIESPSVVDVFGDKNSFYVDVINNTNEVQPLVVNFYSSAKTQISQPKSLAPNSSTKIKITIEHDNKPRYHEVDSKLEIYLGKDLEEKNISIRFYEKNNSSQSLASFLSFSSFSQETSQFVFVEWIIFWVLVIIAAVLLIAFVSKVVRRY